MRQGRLAAIAGVIALSGVAFAAVAPSAVAGNNREIKVLRAIHKNPEQVPNRHFLFNKGTKLYAHPFESSKVVRQIRQHTTLRVTPGPVHVDGNSKFIGFSFSGTKDNHNLRQLAKQELWVKRSDATAVKAGAGPNHVSIHITRHGYVWSPDLKGVNKGTTRG